MPSSKLLPRGRRIADASSRKLPPLILEKLTFQMKTQSSPRLKKSKSDLSVNDASRCLWSSIENCYRIPLEKGSSIIQKVLPATFKRDSTCFDHHETKHRLQ